MEYVAAERLERLKSDLDYNLRLQPRGAKGLPARLALRQASEYQADYRLMAN
jgi:fructose-specific phosphotransferase system component IIB